MWLNRDSRVKYREHFAIDEGVERRFGTGSGRSIPRDDIVSQGNMRLQFGVSYDDVLINTKLSRLE